MAKSIKEVDEISTTDKLKAFKTLKDAGFRVEMNGSGVPTVICVSVDEMDKQLKNRFFKTQCCYICSKHENF